MMTRTAMVVEREPLIRSFIRYVLEAEKYYVIDTSNEADAWNLYKQHSKELNLITIDQELRPRDGIDLYQRIREHDNNVNIIVSSASYEPKLTILEWDPHGYLLHKPFPVEKLRELVNVPTFEKKKQLAR